MATITSHTLNGVDGSHAGGIKVFLHRVGVSEPLMSGQMDEGGRLSLEVDPALVDPSATYELVFATAAYWRDRGLDDQTIIAEIVLRFQMPDASAKYHMPVIVSPYSYSTWKSG